MGVRDHEVESSRGGAIDLRDGLARHAQPADVCQIRRRGDAVEGFSDHAGHGPPTLPLVMERPQRPARSPASSASRPRSRHERLTILLERAESLLDSARWDDRFDALVRLTGNFVHRLFWHALMLIAVVPAGVAALRLLPTRHRRS